MCHKFLGTTYTRIVFKHTNDSILGDSCNINIFDMILKYTPNLLPKQSILMSGT